MDRRAAATRGLRPLDRFSLAVLGLRAAPEPVAVAHARMARLAGRVERALLSGRVPVRRLTGAVGDEG